MLPPKAPINNGYFDRAVTITVLSCDGVVAKKYESKTKWKNRQVMKSTPTSLAASFSQNLSAGDSFLTHVPSMPMEHLDTSCVKPGKAKPIPQPVVRWPGMDVDEGGDETVGKELSTLRFTRMFRRDTDDNVSSTTKLLPETFSIKLSLSRSGKLISLGRADVVVTSGEEKEDSYIDVPISSTIKKTGVSSPIKKSSKNRIPMVRIKGDDMQFGLKGDSTLRVLVSVTDVQEQDGINDVQGNEILRTDTEDVTTDDDECEVNDVTFDLDDKYESFLEFLKDGETGTQQLDEGKVDEVDVDEGVDEDVDEDVEEPDDAPAQSQNEGKEKASDEVTPQVGDGTVAGAEAEVDEDAEAGSGSEAEVDEDEETATDAPTQSQLDVQLGDEKVAETDVDDDEDEEMTTDAAAVPQDEAEVDDDLVGEQKEMAETTDEDKEENTENVENQANNENPIGAWFSNLFGNGN